MSREDLVREIRTHEAAAAKLRLEIEMKKEKNSAKYRNERRHIARMQTVITEMGKVTTTEKAPQKELKKTTKTRTVRAPKKS